MRSVNLHLNKHSDEADTVVAPPCLRKVELDHRTHVRTRTRTTDTQQGDVC